MKINQTNLFTIIEADEGKILLDKNGYGSYKVYLGKYDSVENYTEIPKEDYTEPSEETKVEALEEMIQRILSEEVNKN